MSRIELPRLTIGLLLLAGTMPLGCGHESVAGTSQPPQAALVPTPVAAQAGAASSGADPVETTPASETPPLAAAAQAPQKGPQQPPKDPSLTRAPADRSPTRPGDAEKITFDDLNLGMQADVVYRPFFLTERVKELDGKRVRISGFISAGAESTTKIKEFILLKNTECKFGPGGQADHLTQVYLPPGVTTKYQTDAIKVEGTLKVEPYQGTDGNTWSIFRLDDAKIVR